VTDVRLVPLTEQHLDEVRDMIMTDPVVIEFSRIPDPVPDGFERKWFAMYAAARLDGTREAFAVLEGGRLVALGVAPTIDREQRSVELGYMVAERARGRGVATATLRELTRWAFAELDPVRVELLISDANEASKAVARRCGYTLEGTLRSKYMKPGVWVDTTVWSRLAGE
jgi:RimJ/RimL family protein N-acetyltransferase